MTVGVERSHGAIFWVVAAVRIWIRAFGMSNCFLRDISMVVNLFKEKAWPQSCRILHFLSKNGTYFFTVIAGLESRTLTCEIPYQVWIRPSCKNYCLHECLLVAILKPDHVPSSDVVKEVKVLAPEANNKTTLTHVAFWEEVWYELRMGLTAICNELFDQTRFIFLAS